MKKRGRNKNARTQKISEETVKIQEMRIVQHRKAGRQIVNLAKKERKGGIFKSHLKVRVQSEKDSKLMELAHRIFHKEHDRDDLRPGPEVYRE